MTCMACESLIQRSPQLAAHVLTKFRQLPLVLDCALRIAPREPALPRTTRRITAVLACHTTPVTRVRAARVHLCFAYVAFARTHRRHLVLSLFARHCISFHLPLQECPALLQQACMRRVCIPCLGSAQDTSASFPAAHKAHASLCACSDGGQGVPHVQLVVASQFALPSTTTHVKVVDSRVHKSPRAVRRRLASVDTAHSPLQVAGAPAYVRRDSAAGARGADQACIVSGVWLSQHRAAQRKPSLKSGVSSERCMSDTSATSAFWYRSAFSSGPAMVRARLATCVLYSQSKANDSLSSF